MAIADKGARMYRIIEDLDGDTLAQTVEEYLECGWQCQGGLNTVVVPHGTTGTVYYLQAVVK